MCIFEAHEFERKYWVINNPDHIRAYGVLIRLDWTATTSLLSMSPNSGSCLLETTFYRRLGMPSNSWRFKMARDEKQRKMRNDVQAMANTHKDFKATGNVTLQVNYCTMFHWEVMTLGPNGHMDAGHGLWPWSPWSPWKAGWTGGGDQTTGRLKRQWNQFFFVSPAQSCTVTGSWLLHMDTVLVLNSRTSRTGHYSTPAVKGTS